MRKLLSLLGSCFLLVLAVSCDDFDSWTTSPSATVTFSCDTVAFDTILTAQSSTTRTLVVFNHNDKGVRIRRIGLGQGSASHFRVNVDGEYLATGQGTDFEIRGKDSIYVRVEVLLPESGTADIRNFEDCLMFTLESGVAQKVILTANGMDVVRYGALVIEQDMTLTDPRPLLFRDSLVVAEGATLTIAEGTTLMFHEGAGLTVHGRLVARGTVDKPIVFRGDRVDKMFPYLPYDNTPNRWTGIRFTSTSHDNELVQCDIHSGDFGIVCDSTALTQDVSRMLLLENSVIHNAGGVGLQLTHCVADVFGTQISNTLGHCVSVKGGAYTFLHCTLAQFYPWSAKRGDALYITNPQNDIYYPLAYCHFWNSIITGYADDVIMGDIAENQDYQCDYLFAHSLLRTVVSDDEQRFREVRYDIKDSTEVCAKDNFLLFDTNNFRYDFQPDSLSTARHLANPQVSALCPFDRRGVSRLSDEKPTAGAYQYELKGE